MKIIKLSSNNIKRIKAVELTLDENKNLILVTGKNSQGKSSLLDSIWIALGGKKSIPEKPIREGEKEATIELNLDNYIVKRTFTETGSYLKVENPKGEQFSNPQEFLDFILGNLTFDPLLFSKMDPKKQVEELSRVVGVDFKEYNENQKIIANERLNIGRQIKEFPKYTDELIKKLSQYTDKTEISIVSLGKQMSDAKEQRMSYLAKMDKIKENEKKIAEMRESIMALESDNKIILEGAKDTEIDIPALEKQMLEAEETNKNIRAAKEVFGNLEKKAEKNKEYEGLTEQLRNIDLSKRDDIAKAKMPIDGLTFTEDLVLYNQIPYNQLSQSEQLRVSMAIAMATNPKLKVILIKDGSLLDQDNLKVIEEMAKDKDFQVWVEKVDDTGKVGIVIEDGAISSINN